MRYLFFVLFLAGCSSSKPKYLIVDCFNKKETLVTKLTIPSIDIEVTEPVVIGPGINKCVIYNSNM